MILFSLIFFDKSLIPISSTGALAATSLSSSYVLALLAIKDWFLFNS